MCRVRGVPPAGLCGFRARNLCVVNRAVRTRGSTNTVQNAPLLLEVLFTKLEEVSRHEKRTDNLLRTSLLNSSSSARHNYDNGAYVRT